MESAAVSGLAMDCEDMFKEITKKLYGEEATVGGVIGVEFPAAERDLEEDLRPEEHITAWGLAALMQNGFPPPGILQAMAERVIGIEFPEEQRDLEKYPRNIQGPKEHFTAWGLAELMQNVFPPPEILQANFTPRIDPAAEDRWTAAEEPLAWAHSRVASYNPAQRLFKCTECECVGFLARVAEHWLGTHSHARVFHCPLAQCGFASGWARAVRQHLARDHHSDPAAADQLLRDNPALDDVTRYLQRLKTKVENQRNERRATPVAPAAPEPPPEAEPAAAEPGKRYACPACPYATDRRDLFTRHENIHRDEKPFHCYLCQKQFNRADHVKKHFLRMHRDQPYDLNRIRRPTGKQQPTTTNATHHYYTKPPAEPPPAQPQEYRPPVKIERPPLAKAETPTTIPQPQQQQQQQQQKPVPNTNATPVATSAGVRRKGERRYACCYCSWSGVDNWCLKRHLNTHLKPFACALCEYKAARAERLATHVHKVHNKKACAKCPFLADDQNQLSLHLREAHHIESRNLKVPSGVRSFPPAEDAAPRRREQRAAGAARLFGYLEASDNSGDEYEAPLQQFAAAGGSAQPAQHYRDKENAAPALHEHDHCLRY